MDAEAVAAREEKTFLSDPLEIAAAAFGLASVVLAVRENVLNFPVGIVQVSLYIYVYYAARLYSDMLLHIIYVPILSYGWWNWLYGADTELPVTRLGGGGLAFWIVAGLLGTLLLGWLMKRRTRAALPYWDAATTCLSLVAQWLMAQKKVESWGFWITVDVIAIGVYYVKRLRVTCLLYAVFLILATQGLLAWLKVL